MTACLELKIPAFPAWEEIYRSPAEPASALWDCGVGNGGGFVGDVGCGGANVKGRLFHRYPSLRSLNQQFPQDDVSVDGFGAVGVAGAAHAAAAATDDASSFGRCHVDQPDVADASHFATVAPFAKECPHTHW